MQTYGWILGLTQLGHSPSSDWVAHLPSYPTLKLLVFFSSKTVKPITFLDELGYGQVVFTMTLILNFLEPLDQLISLYNDIDIKFFRTLGSTN